MAGKISAMTVSLRLLVGCEQSRVSTSTMVLEIWLRNITGNGKGCHTSACGSHSFGGVSAERRQLSIANKTRSFPGVGNGTFDTTWDIMSHNGLLK